MYIKFIYDGFYVIIGIIENLFVDWCKKIYVGDEVI